ncbi:MAG TPA: c-type cytochrome biogenesis protein CcmI, partial [Burkholderiales bacterium]|nr:c-type cytochrome biogenesis protein CcmI [Burkholderiales bacterium]
VRIVPALAEKSPADATVFVFARAAQGPRMPLAIVRLRRADLPATFVLDDSVAMNPQLRLSSVDRLLLGARLSRSGNAMPAPGDLQSRLVEVANRASGIELVIDQEVR